MVKSDEKAKNTKNNEEKAQNGTVVGIAATDFRVSAPPEFKVLFEGFLKNQPDTVCLVLPSDWRKRVLT